MQNLLSRRRLYASWLPQKPTNQPPNEANFRRLWVSLDPKLDSSTHSSTTSSTKPLLSNNHSRSTSKSLPSPSTSRSTTRCSKTSSSSASSSSSRSRSSRNKRSPLSRSQSHSTSSRHSDRARERASKVIRAHLRPVKTDFPVPVSPSSRLGALLPNRAGTMLSPLPETTVSAPTTPQGGHARERDTAVTFLRASHSNNNTHTGTHSDNMEFSDNTQTETGTVASWTTTSHEENGATTLSSQSTASSDNPRRKLRRRANLNRSSSQERASLLESNLDPATAPAPATAASPGGRWSRRNGSEKTVPDDAPKGRQRRAQSVGRNPRSKT